jgi:hypothetical protein
LGVQERNRGDGKEQSRGETTSWVLAGKARLVDQKAVAAALKNRFTHGFVLHLATARRGRRRKKERNAEMDSPGRGRLAVCMRGEFDFVELRVSLQYSALCEPSLVRNLQILSRESLYVLKINLAGEGEEEL